MGPTARRTGTRRAGQADVPAPLPSVSRRSIRSRVSLCVCVRLVPVNHPRIFWAQLGGHRRFFSSLCRHLGLHTLSGVGSWQLWTVPEITPRGFHKKSQLLKTSKISQTCFLSGALSARKRLHYLSIAAFLTSLVTGYHFFTDAFFFLIIVAIPSPFVHPKEKTKKKKTTASNTCDIQANKTGSLFFKGPEGPKELTVILMTEPEIWRCLKPKAVCGNSSPRPLQSHALHLVFLSPHRFLNYSGRWEHHRRVGWPRWWPCPAATSHFGWRTWNNLGPCNIFREIRRAPSILERECIWKIFANSIFMYILHWIAKNQV